MTGRGFSVTDRIVTKDSFLRIIRAELKKPEADKRAQEKPQKSAGLEVEIVEQAVGAKESRSLQSRREMARRGKGRVSCRP